MSQRRSMSFTRVQRSYAALFCNHFDGFYNYTSRMCCTLRSQFNALCGSRTVTTTPQWQPCTTLNPENLSNLDDSQLHVPFLDRDRDVHICFGQETRSHILDLIFVYYGDGPCARRVLLVALLIGALDSASYMYTYMFKCTKEKVLFK